MSKSKWAGAAVVGKSPRLGELLDKLQAMCLGHLYAVQRAQELDIQSARPIPTAELALEWAECLMGIIEEVESLAVVETEEELRALIERAKAVLQ